MLITTYLSAKSPVFIAPAMDLDMMAHPSTQANLRLLESYGNHIIEPETGYLASGLTGKGRMEEPEKILEVLEKFFSVGKSMEEKKVLITAGPTYEKIDPVRFIGNYSSGKMGYALADECASRGADVTLVSGPVSVSVSNPSIKVVKIESAKEMLAECEKVFPTSDVAIMCAAVADYAPAHTADSKIKREHQEIPVIELVKNPDIAATLGAMKKSSQTLVGFALETDHEFENAVEKLNRKNLDMIVLNSMRDSGAGFGTDTNKVTIFTRDSRCEYPLKSKKDVAKDIVDAIISKKCEQR